MNKIKIMIYGGEISMKKVMVHAVTKLNLGDDLFLDLLFKRYPKTKFILSTHKNYKKYYKKYNNISIHSTSNIVFRGMNFLMRKLGQRVYTQKRLAKKCDASIHIGGSIFQQKAHWKNQIKNRKTLLIENQPYYVLGANFGSYTDPQFHEEYFNLFKSYKDICFRDSYSCDLFKELPNVRKADDIVFSLKNDFQLESERKIVISVIKPSFRPYLKNRDYEYYDKIKDIAVNYVKDGYDVVLMSFCKAEGDEKAIEKVKSMIPEEYISKIKSHKYYGDIDKALNEIASASAIVATRFHAMILGWVYNKPTFPIAYNEKMFNVMKDVSYDGKYVNFDNLDTFTYEDYQINSYLKIIDITMQIKDSEKHFKALDDFLM